MPEQDLCSFVMPYYQKQEAYLRKELKTLQGENAALAQRVQAGREGIAQAEQRIAATVDEWKVSKRDRIALLLNDGHPLMVELQYPVIFYMI